MLFVLFPAGNVEFVCLNLIISSELMLPVSGFLGLKLSSLFSIVNELVDCSCKKETNKGSLASKIVLSIPLSVYKIFSKDKIYFVSLKNYN